MVRLAELGRVRVNELTTLEILPPLESSSKATIDLKQGAMYFFTRDRPREFLIQTPHAMAASRGTEFLVTLEPAGRAVFTVFDGEVELSNALGTVVVFSGEQGTASPGQPPRKTAVIQSANIVQWWLYYPAILDPDEISLSPTEQTQLTNSLSAYRLGDVLSALQNYPNGRISQSDAERVYVAAILLGAGQVDKSEAQLGALVTPSPLANALREMIASASVRSFPGVPNPQSTTEWLAKSYVAQARYDLKTALASARAATEKSPNFGFAWARVAELEFSFGHNSKASEALARALALSPRNAQAWALKGFLSASERRWAEAQGVFDKAISLDPALGNGWLGRGLVRLRVGEIEAGRSDLQTAAAMEPNRSLLRSYLGKAFETTGGVQQAQKELRLARKLDENDPTPWLYSALVLRQQLLFNDAIDDLEKSAALNDNRRVFRSRLMLDQDLAVRSASLATIYDDAGLREVSVREASRAVAADYGNYSAHLFLAESFDALRDPTRFNLRIETAWFNELLLANLLAPVGGGNLSPNISQQEYSRLFATDRLGLSSFTEARSDGQYRELASQFGTYKDFSYSLDLDFQRNEGVRPNNELTRIEWYSSAKYQLSPNDSVLVLTKYQDYHSGDNFQYYDQRFARTNFTFDEFQSPLALVGYHREWSPGIHTLFLGGRLENDQRFSDTDVNELILSRNTNHEVVALNVLPFDIKYRSVFEAWTAELNQILQFEHHIFVLGGRFQTGTFETTNALTFNPSNNIPVFFFNNPPAAANVEDDFKRISTYGYYTWEPVPELHLTGGLTYDLLTFPINFRQPPVSEGSITRDRISPKAALVWSPRPEIALRAAYSRSLGGVTFDESFRLEPTQLAGFSQSFRNLISESVVGSVTAPTYETIGAALDLKFKSRTYVGIQGQFLNSEVNREVGVFDFSGALPPPPPIQPSSTAEHLDYDEYSTAATINQLISTSWSLGIQYVFTRSKLHTVFPEIPVTSSITPQGFSRARKHNGTIRTIPAILRLCQAMTFLCTTFLLAGGCGVKREN